MRYFYFIILSAALTACASWKIPNYETNQNAVRVPASADTPEEFSNIIAQHYGERDTYSELAEIIKKDDWLGIRVKSALKIIKSLDLYIVHDDIYCDSDFSKHCPTGVITKSNYEKYYKNKELYAGLVYFRMGHKIYTMGEMIDPVPVHALMYLVNHGYVFNEKTKTWEPVARPGR